MEWSPNYLQNTEGIGVPPALEKETGKGKSRIGQVLFIEKSEKNPRKERRVSNEKARATEQTHPDWLYRGRCVRPKYFDSDYFSLRSWIQLIFMKLSQNVDFVYEEILNSHS